MPDLSTVYLGLDLESPLVASASPLTSSLDSLVRLQDAGAAAVVLPSLFEEQIEHDEFTLHARLEQGSHSFGEALTYLPELEDYDTGTGSYLELIELAKGTLRIPVIASLNGATPGGWVRYAKLCEAAGADAIELNVYAVEARPETDGAAVERRLLELTREVRAAVAIPLAVKLGPFYSAFANVATRLADAGVDGLVCFNRFLGPDLDLEAMRVEPTIHLSTPDELRLVLRWLAILRKRVPIDLAATGGIHSADDAIKAILAGADVVMLASSLLRHGPEHLTALRTGIAEWLAAREYVSSDQARGSMSQGAGPDPSAFERAQYVYALQRGAHGITRG
ncbi:MAG: dihydroorotate dehydrogenase-like protein [Gaiellales bacterium]